MKNKHILSSLIILLIGFSDIYSQATLIQSFIEENILGGTRLGSAVSTAGDVNGDGFDDILIGAPSHSTGIGRTYLFYGSNDIDNDADVIFDGEGNTNYFGSALSSAGDVNNDGFDDIIIGASDHNSGTGKVYLYFGGSSVNNSVDLTFEGSSILNFFGISLSTAGDFNDDGFDDIIIGSTGHNSSTGRAYIYLGGNSMDNTVDAVLDGESSYNYFARSVSGGGDLNNDGYDDIVVGANGSYKAYIYYGSSYLDDTVDVVLDESGAQFGNSVSMIGDVNGDGFDDIIVGAYSFNSSTGRSYIYYGGTVMNNLADVTLDGENTNEYFGISVSKAGDINNDGFDDVIIGASRYNSYTGRSYIYLGSSSMSTTPVLVIDGDSESGYFGNSVSYAGDVNNDGFDDFLIGAHRQFSDDGRAYIYYGGNTIDNIADNTFREKGSGNNFGQSASNAGDVNGDGFDDVIIGAYGFNNFTGRAYIYLGSNLISSSPDIILTGETNNSFFGSSVSNAGDINDDGFDDVIIGAYGYNNSRGRAYIYLGGTIMDNELDVLLESTESNYNYGQFVTSAGDFNGDGFDDVLVSSPSFGNVYLYLGSSTMNDISDLKFTQVDYPSTYGYSIANTGDFNNDGFDDIIIGAPTYNSRTGRAYIYFGGSSMNNTVDLTITGESSSMELGSTVAPAGDINNDGYDDFMIGLPGYLSNTGMVNIYYGSSSPDIVEDVSLTGTVLNESFGASLSSAGDVNNDRYSDIIIGTFGSNKAYLFLGGNFLDSEVDVEFEGLNSTFGLSVSSCGDINNDGNNEIIIGQPSFQQNGIAYIYSFTEFPESTESEDVDQNVQADLDFPSANIGLNLLPDNGTTITVSKYDSPPSEGGFTIGTGVNTTIPAYWHITTDSPLTFTNGKISIPLSEILAIDPSLNTDNIVWIKRDDSNDDWISIGGSDDGNGNFVSTQTFSSFSEFTVGFSSLSYNLKVFLEGAFSSPNMTNTFDLSTQLTQPYSSPIHDGTESVDVEVFNSHPDIVDWVVVELRTGTDANTKVSSRAAFLKSDGSIVDLDGTSDVSFEGLNESLDYYVVIHHRNHLPVMSASAVPLN